MTTGAELPALLKHLRERAGMSQTDLALRLCVITGTSTVTRSEVSRWERGKRRPNAWLPALATALDVDCTVLKSATERDRAVTQTAHKELGWLIGVGALESEWDQLTGPLRRAFLKRGGAAIALPAVNMEELQHITAALDDARRYADAAVVDYFHRRLDESASLDGSGGPATGISTVLGLVAAIDQTAREAKPAIARELLRTAARAAELLGWLYRDLAAAESAAYWRDHAMEWAQSACDPAMQGYILLKKAQAAWDDRDARAMQTLVQAVQEGPWRLPRHVRAEAEQQAVRAYAMLGGDLNTMEARIARARELLAEDSASRGIGSHFNRALFELQVAICYTEAGHPAKALELYNAHLAESNFSQRDQGYFLALQAGAHAVAHDPDSAATSAQAALAIAQSTNSVRTHREILRVLDQLRPWRQRPAVRELRQTVLV